MADKTDFMAQAKQQMDAWTQEVAKMQAKMSEASAKGQEAMKAQLASFEEQRAHAQKHMEELGKANMNAAKEIQVTMQKAWSDMEAQMKEMQKKFGQ